MIEEDDEFKLFFLDESEGEFSEEQLDFIDDKDGEEQEERSFYRSADNNEAVKFSNQTKNPHEVVTNQKMNIMVKMTCQNCSIQNTEKMLDLICLIVLMIKIALSVLKMLIISFFYAIIYVIMHHRLNEKNITLENAENVLGPKFFIELKKIEKVSMLDHPIFGFFDRCREINNVLSEFGFFLRFYEKRSKFRFQLRQKLKDKNHIKRELSTCIIQKFNGYELL